MTFLMIYGEAVVLSNAFYRCVTLDLSCEIQKMK